MKLLFPVILLSIFYMAYNVYVFGDEAMGGSNQFILLLIGGAIAAIGLGLNKGIRYLKMMINVKFLKT